MVEERCTYPITQDEVALLEEAERQAAAQTQVEEYKFDSNAAMLAAIDSRRLTWPESVRPLCLCRAGNPR